MELRVLRYFLMVAKEQSFTKAAAQLHITQPTLSRQMASLEKELNAPLFVRGGHSISLTEQGLLLKRRALELIDLEDRIIDEFKEEEGTVLGTITIGCGESAAVEILAEMISRYKERCPLVQIALHTGTADTIRDMMNKGLVDIGLFLEPVSTEELDYIRIKDSDHWVIGMRPDDPLAKKKHITKEDLLKLPLILPERYSIQSELANWFGKEYTSLNIAFVSNLGTNAAVMAMNGLGYPISIEGAAKYWREDLIVQRPLFPEIKSNSVIAWRRNIPHAKAVRLFIAQIRKEE